MGEDSDGGRPERNEELRRLAAELVDESRRLRERSDELLEKARKLAQIIDDGKNKGPRRRRDA
jgi:hypothetical protein